MNSKISVIVPVYNVEAYLERCLDSIINNTYKNLEIICVDDGSTDGCGAILDRYAQADERFVVIHQENGGLSAARNSGMDVATGDYIAFIDSDDWIHPQYFKILLGTQKKENYDLVICGFSRPTEMEVYVPYDLSVISGKALDLEGIYRIRDAKGYVWGKLYRKDLVAGKRFIEKIRIAEDFAFNALVLGNFEMVKAYYISIPLYFYFDRPGSLAYALKGKEILDLGEILFQYAQKSVTLRVKKMQLLEALKRGLSSRYILMLQAEDPESLERSVSLVRSGVRELNRLPNASVKEKLLYSVCGYLPNVYRLWRIYDDPTLMKMEKDLRRKKRG